MLGIVFAVIVVISFIFDIVLNSPFYFTCIAKSILILLNSIFKIHVQK